MCDDLVALYYETPSMDGMIATWSLVLRLISSYHCNIMSRHSQLSGHTKQAKTQPRPISSASTQPKRNTAAKLVARIQSPAIGPPSLVDANNNSEQDIMLCAGTMHFMMAWAKQQVIYSLYDYMCMVATYETGCQQWVRRVWVWI